MEKFVLRVGALIGSSQDVRSEPSYLVISGNTIESVGTGEIPEAHRHLPVVYRPQAVAMPGLVNTHGHAAMTLLRGLGDDLPLMTWLSEKVYPNEAKLNADAIYWGTMLASLEMLRSGTTCFTDMYFFMHDTARAVADSGIRGVLSWGMVGFSDADRTKGIEQSTDFISQWHKAANGRITTTLGPHAPYTCPPDYLEEIATLSAHLDIPIQIHLSETEQEITDAYRDFGVSPIAHAKNCGLFERPLLAAHCVHVSDDDIELLAQHNVHVAHNPQSNLKLGSGVAPLHKLLGADVTVGLGTDGAASNNNLDMFEELRLAATLHKGILKDATAIPAATAFELATAKGAAAIFLGDGHGTLSAGAPADIVLLDGQSPHFWPHHDLLSNVVYAAGADDVTDVFVAGNHVLSNREALTVDTERLHYEISRIANLLHT